MLVIVDTRYIVSSSLVGVTTDDLSRVRRPRVSKTIIPVVSYEDWWRIISGSGSSTLKFNAMIKQPITNSGREAGRDFNFHEKCNCCPAPVLQDQLNLQPTNLLENWPPPYAVIRTRSKYLLRASGGKKNSRVTISIENQHQPSGALFLLHFFPRLFKINSKIAAPPSELQTFNLSISSSWLPLLFFPLGCNVQCVLIIGYIFFCFNSACVRGSVSIKFNGN